MIHGMPIWSRTWKNKDWKVGDRRFGRELLRVNVPLEIGTKCDGT